MNESNGTTGLRPSQRANFLLVTIVSGVLIGLLLGWLLPWEVWRKGSTPIGDFSIVALLGYLSWFVVRGGPTKGRLALVAVAVLVAVGLREVSWRMYPALLAMEYGVATTVLISASLGTFVQAAVLSVRHARRFSLGSLFTLEGVLSLLLGLLLLVWLSAATIATLVTQAATAPVAVP